MGMSSYLAELGLPDQELWDAQRNSFDPLAVALRLHEGVRRWASGETLGTHAFPPMQTVANAFAAVRQCVQDRGLLGVDHPFPYDPRQTLLGAGNGRQLSDTPAAAGNASDDSRLAVEYGRREKWPRATPWSGLA